MEKFLSFKKAVKIYKDYCEDVYHNHLNKKQKRKSKNFYNKNNFHREDCWNIDCWFYANILPRLCYLRDHHMGVPNCYVEFDEYHIPISTIEEEDKKYISDLNFIIKYFYIAYKDTYWLNAKEEEIIKTREEIQKARELFAKLLPTLWD